MGWYKRFVLWHEKRHPAEMGAPEVEAFLTHLMSWSPHGHDTLRSA
ncbi:MAG: phage integrase N-terminal SAM-like domain-containing protein [Verrucomicrobia bacterium]|nr:phage integrase N-terminal SAM-like domain-containing protein [Verrucomicrobiota bacterium]